MNDVTKQKIESAIKTFYYLGVGHGCSGTDAEIRRQEAEAAEAELRAHVQFLEDQLSRATRELAYKNSGLWNRFRTWFGCLRARHYAEMEDIQIALNQLTGTPAPVPPAPVA